MIRFKDISIPKPCSVQYDLFPGDDIKRFCGSCKKDVYDFRGKDEAHLNGILSKAPKTCGVFYLDEISTYNKPIAVPKYHKRLLLKIISTVFFIKSFLTVQHSKAAQPAKPETQQHVESDSNKVKFASKRMVRLPVYINIYVNDALYKQYKYPQNSPVYLPDSIKSDDKIKVVVLKSKYVKKRTYSFTYSAIETITVEIIGKNPIQIVPRRQVMGCPSNFW